MNDLIIGKGKLASKGAYANRNFKKGEIVVKYNLKPLSKKEYKDLPRDEKRFTHVQWGQIYLYSEPERYVNHSKAPNTYQDHKLHADVALRDIEKGEMVTTDATKDNI